MYTVSCFSLTGPLHTQYDFQLSVLTGFLSMRMSGSLVPFPRFLSFCLLVLFYLSAVVFILSHFVLFYYCPLEACLLCNDRQKRVDRGGVHRGEAIIKIIYVKEKG